MNKEELKKVLGEHKKWLAGNGGTKANLGGADLSQAKGLLSASDWMSENFKAAKDGYVVYKSFGSFNAPPDAWIIEPGSIIEEVCHPDRTLDCACGVNFGTLEWLKEHSGMPAWECLIEWKDLPGVVVPYHTDGKARCERLKIIRLLEDR